MMKMKQKEKKKAQKIQSALISVWRMSGSIWGDAGKFFGLLPLLHSNNTENNEIYNHDRSQCKKISNHLKAEAYKCFVAFLYAVCQNNPWYHRHVWCLKRFLRQSKACTYIFCKKAHTKELIIFKLRLE